MNNVYIYYIYIHTTYIYILDIYIHNKPSHQDAKVTAGMAPHAKFH